MWHPGVREIGSASPLVASVFQAKWRLPKPIEVHISWVLVDRDGQQFTYILHIEGT